MDYWWLSPKEYNNLIQKTQEIKPGPLSLSYNDLDHRWVFLCSKETKYIPKEKGFWWDPSQLVWWSYSPDKARELIYWPDLDALAWLQKVYNKIRLVEDGNGIFIALCDYLDKNLAKTAGCRWDSHKKTWWTDDPYVVEQLSDYLVDYSLWAAYHGKRQEAEIRLAINDCTDKATLSATRRILARKHHPDIGGDPATMSMINQLCDLHANKLEHGY